MMTIEIDNTLMFPSDDQCDDAPYVDWDKLPERLIDTACAHGPVLVATLGLMAFGQYFITGVDNDIQRSMCLFAMLAAIPAVLMSKEGLFEDRKGNSLLFLDVLDDEHRDIDGVASIGLNLH